LAQDVAKKGRIVEFDITIFDLKIINNGTNKEECYIFMNDAPLPLKNYLLINKNTVKCNRISTATNHFFQ
jgi:hypothetical protein